MKVAYDTLNDGEKSTEHWSTILSVLTTITVCFAFISASVLDFSFVESMALCVLPVVFISALAVFVLESPTPQFIVSLLLTGFLLSPLYSMVGHGITYLLTTMGNLL